MDIEIVRKFRWWRENHNLTWHDIKQGVKNLVCWFPAVWRDRWWDHSFLYSILRHKLVQMEKGFSGPHAMSANAKRDAKNMKICILLLDRLINDDYIDYSQPDNIRKSFEEEQKMIEQDLDLLFKIIRRHIRTWWD